MKKHISSFNEYFLNENKSYITNEILHYIVDDEYFKSNGYTFQELFASDTPYYHKKVNERTIWCNAEDKSIFIQDWYDFLTPCILNYFIQNKEDSTYSKTFDYSFLSLRLNRQTGEIVKKTIDMTINYDNCIYMDRPWVELVLPVEGTSEIVDEVNRLTNNKFIL